MEGQERILGIDDNVDALLWRLCLIEAAQERVILATFDFRDDKSGQDIMASLLNAADRGVKVQILIDGINGRLRLSKSKNFQELIAHENVEAKLYNPVNLMMPWKINYRMHDKYLIVDDFAYILGGRNTDNIFLGDYKKSYNQDRDILVYETIPGEGMSFVQLTEYFEQIWNLPYCKEYKKQRYAGEYLKKHYQEMRSRYPDAFIEPVWEEITIETNGVELCTNPMESNNKVPELWERLVYEMNQCEDILIQTPYIICNRKMYQDLKNICAESKRVDIILNAVESGTNPFGCTDYLNQKYRVRKTGIYTYEYLGEQAVHTKTILVGDNISIVGSYNLDMRSTYLDTEMMLVIDCPELNASIRSQAEKMKEASRQIAPNGAITDGKNYPSVDQDIGKKVYYGILRVIIIPFRHLL
ncbi:MAG: phosphatidylserine/phosphatidylglycerophosphate/cardiolipin synthase family protein [Lachnospiraceae bacterium]